MKINFKLKFMHTIHINCTLVRKKFKTLKEDY